MNIDGIRLKRIRAVLIAFFVLAILYMVIPTIFASAYSVFIDDDFVHAAKVEKINEVHRSYLLSCWLFMADKYMHWQGNYFSMFIQVLFSPVNQGGFAMLRTIMLGNSISFFVVFCIFVFVMLRRMGLDDILPRLGIFAALIFSMTAFNSFQEVFYWYSGITSYTIPLTTFMLAVILFDRAEAAGNVVIKRILMSFSLLFMFFVGGGTLALAGVACWIMLVWNFVVWLRKRRASKGLILMFLAVFFGTIVTVIAPGNYERQSVAMGDSGGGLINALYYTLRGHDDNLEWMFHRMAFPITLLVVFIMGALYSKELSSKIKEIMIAGILLLPLHVIAIFPVVYGYSSYWIPNRCVFIIIYCIVLEFATLSLALGAFTAELFTTPGEKRLLVVMSLLAIFLFLSLAELRFEDYKFNTTWKNIAKGVYQENYSDVRGILDDLYNHPGEDIELQVSGDMNSIEGFMNFYLCGENEPNDAFNADIAYLYGVNSITRIPVSE